MSVYYIIYYVYSYELSAALVQCLKAVANTYHPAILETTFPESLFKSLVKLYDIRHPGNSSVAFVCTVSV